MVKKLFFSPLDDDFLPVVKQEERLAAYEAGLEAQSQQVCGLSRKEHEADFLNWLNREAV